MAAVRVQFLGSGDAFGSGGRLQTCLHVHGADEALLIDCGSTALIALKRARIDPGDVGWIALSHLHGDHFGGLPFLTLDQQFAGRSRPLVVAGPPGTRQRLEEAMEALFPGSSGARRRFETRFIELEERVPCEVGPALITPFEVRHESGAPAYALRAEYGGKVIGYSGDTEWTDSLVDAARGADLFVCEAYSFDKRIPYHLDYQTLAENRDRLQCERIVVTHMSDDVLARLGDVELEAAADGAIIAL